MATALGPMSMSIEGDVDSMADPHFQPMLLSIPSFSIKETTVPTIIIPSSSPSNAPLGKTPDLHVSDAVQSTCRHSTQWTDTTNTSPILVTELSNSNHSTAVGDGGKVLNGIMTSDTSQRHDEQQKKVRKGHNQYTKAAALRAVREAELLLLQQQEALLPSTISTPQLPSRSTSMQQHLQIIESTPMMTVDPAPSDSIEGGGRQRHSNDAYCTSTAHDSSTSSSRPEVSSTENYGIRSSERIGSRRSRTRMMLIADNSNDKLLEVINANEINPIEKEEGEDIGRPMSCNGKLTRRELLPNRSSSRKRRRNEQQQHGEDVVMMISSSSRDHDNGTTPAMIRQLRNGHHHHHEIVVPVNSALIIETTHPVEEVLTSPKFTDVSTHSSTHIVSRICLMTMIVMMIMITIIVMKKIMT